MARRFRWLEKKRREKEKQMILHGVGLGVVQDEYWLDLALLHFGVRGERSNLDREQKHT
jgi:hypothetical protein